MTTDEKLYAIILPEIKFDHMPLPAAIALLTEQARRSDDTAQDPVQAGVSIGYLLADDVANSSHITLELHDADLRGALTAIAEQSGLALYVNVSGAFLLPPYVAIALGLSNEVGVQAHIAELTAQIKAKGNPLGDDYDADAVEDLRSQLIDAKIELRWMQERGRHQTGDSR